MACRTRNGRIFRIMWYFLTCSMGIHRTVRYGCSLRLVVLSVIGCLNSTSALADSGAPLAVEGCGRDRSSLQMQSQPSWHWGIENNDPKQYPEGLAGAFFFNYGNLWATNQPVYFKGWDQSQTLGEAFCFLGSIATVLMYNEWPATSTFSGHWDENGTGASETINQIWRYSDIKDLSSTGGLANWYKDDPEARYMQGCTTAGYCKVADEIRRLYGAIRIALGIGDKVLGCVWGDESHEECHSIGDVLTSYFGYKYRVLSLDNGEIALTASKRRMLKNSLNNGNLVIVRTGVPWHVWVLDGYRYNNGEEYHALNYGGGNSGVSKWVSDPTNDGHNVPGGVWYYDIMPRFQYIQFLAGDADFFLTENTEPNSVDPDYAPQSQRVKDIVNWIGKNPDQGTGVNLDVGGVNRPVGLTHFFSLPDGALITGAKVRFRARGYGAFYNDGIIYEPIESLGEDKRSNPPSSYSKSVKDDENCMIPIDLMKCDREDFYPYITLRDLLGYEPINGQPFDFKINLAKVPLRTKDVGHIGGDPWSTNPDEYRDLLGLLSDGQFDLIFTDDTELDYSRLQITYTSVRSPLGDMNGDDFVDRSDLNIIMEALGTNRYGSDDPRDLDGDTKITTQDARKLVGYCNLKGCERLYGEYPG